MGMRAGNACGTSPAETTRRAATGPPAGLPFADLRSVRRPSPACVRGVDVFDAPVDARRGLRGIWQQSELETTDVEAHVKRLVEVRAKAQELRVPLLARGDIRRVVDGGTQT